LGNSKTEFGAPPELSSTDKADFYRLAYEAVTSSNLCLGSFAFTWGSKIETTSSWFGMFLPTGEKLASVDAMTELWSGEKQADLCPEIRSFELVGSDIVQTGETVQIKVDIVDPEGSDVVVDWKVCTEPTEYMTFGDIGSPPLELDGIIRDKSNNGAAFIFPFAGIFRIYFTAYDGNGGAATANIPIKITGEPGEIKLKLPFAVYADDHPMPWFSSGWMGDTDKLELDLNSNNTPHSGNTCLKVRYSKSPNWAGVAWQSPANDWGDKPGGYNLTGATKLTFWAKGEMGGEVINFGVGLLASDKKYFDSTKAELKNVKLKTKWKKYTINLKNRDLTKLKTPFVFTLLGSNHTTIFYLDDIRFE